MKKTALYPVLCAVSMCAFLFSTGMTYASWKTQSETVNTISMASVKGQIVEEYEQGQVVYPNGTVRKTVQVRNTGTVDALPRVKIEKAWGDNRDENGKLLINSELSTDNIEIHYNTEKWLYNENDGYYYYQEVLKPGDTTVSLFDSFTVNGENTGSEYKNKQADITVNMEMVQAAGGGLSYWGTSFEKLGIVYTQTENAEMITTVDFNSPDAGFSFDVNGGDLFADFKNLVPGESRSQVVEITNQWNRETEIFLRADFVEQIQATDENRELINRLLHDYAVVVITDDEGTVIYNGPVWGNPDVDSYGTDSMKYPYSLGTFTEGQTKKLHISLSLDPQADNQYKELLGLIKWVFSAQGDEFTDTPTPEPTEAVTPGPTVTITPEPTVTQGQTATPKPTGSEVTPTPPGITPQSPKTGDSSGVVMYGTLAVISFLLMLVSLKRARDEVKR